MTLLDIVSQRDFYELETPITHQGLLVLAGRLEEALMHDLTTRKITVSSSLTSINLLANGQNRLFSSMNLCANAQHYAIEFSKDKEKLRIDIHKDAPSILMVTSTNLPEELYRQAHQIIGEDEQLYSRTIHPMPCELQEPRYHEHQ